MWISDTIYWTHRESHTKSCYFVLVSSSSGEFFIQHYSGLCVGYDNKNNQLILTIKCADEFILTKDHNLKHVQTGMCVDPDNNGTNNATIRPELIERETG